MTNIHVIQTGNTSSSSGDERRQFRVRYDGPLFFDGELVVIRDKTGDRVEWNNPGWGADRIRNQSIRVSVPRERGDDFWSALDDLQVLQMNDHGEFLIDFAIYRISLEVGSVDNEFIVYTPGEHARLPTRGRFRASERYRRLFDAFRELGNFALEVSENERK